MKTKKKKLFTGLLLQKNNYILEVGGFFEFPNFDCKNFKKSAFYYLTNIHKNTFYYFFGDGRQAIKSVLLNNKEKLKRSICYLPAYLCYSILQPFLELNLNINFYKSSFNLKPRLSSEIENSLIFIIDYFGTEFVSNEKILDFLKKGNIVILDITHSILNKNRLKINHKNLYQIASLRKIFPIPDGGVLYYSNEQFKINTLSNNDYKKMLEAMKLKKNYLKNKFHNITSINIKSHFLKIYKSYENNKNKKIIKIKTIPAISLDILKNIDIFKIKERRKSNINFLYRNLTKKIFFFSVEMI